MDLLSLELHLRPAVDQPVDERPLPRWWGEAAHRLAIFVIASGDEALAKKLDASDGLKPFTTSNLRGPFPNGRLDPGALYKLRLTALDQKVADIFEAARKAGTLKTGANVELDFLRFQVQDEANGEAGPAGATYQSLTNGLFAPEPPPHRLTLQFTSPTVFKSDGRQFPFPLPEMVFGSLLEHWNASESIPTPLPAEARKYARECLRLGRFDLHSRFLRLHGEPFHGFTGRVTFHTLNYDRYWMSMMAMLARYAAFAGVGAKTTMGLGQCYFVPETPAPAPV
jgi:CRISPR-associated endoribonuclease Cas6